jgi:DNA-binding LacI/PurR family transcriptional regulator
VTLRDLAQKVGVPHVTVSQTLRNDPSISAKRREEVKKLAEEMGCRPDPSLSALAAYRFAKQSHKIQSALAWVIDATKATFGVGTNGYVSFTMTNESIVLNENSRTNRTGIFNRT